MADSETNLTPAQVPGETDERIVEIKQLATSFINIVAAGESNDPHDFFATDEQLAILESRLAACPGYSAEQTAVLRGEANRLAHSLTTLYASEGYGNAIPESKLEALDQGVGKRFFVVNMDTFLALRQAIGGEAPGQAESIARLWITRPDSKWGGEMIPRGHIVLLCDPSQYEWPREMDGVVTHAEQTGIRLHPIFANGGWRSVVAENYAASSVAEELVHLYEDHSLPLSVREVAAKATAAALLEYVGYDRALTGPLRRCFDYQTTFENGQNPEYHGLARLGFGNSSYLPASRTAKIEQIERDAPDLLGESYADLFNDMEHLSEGYAEQLA